jgi:hypothetical protein
VDGDCEQVNDFLVLPMQNKFVFDVLPRQTRKFVKRRLIFLSASLNPLTANATGPECVSPKPACWFARQSRSIGLMIDTKCVDVATAIHQRHFESMLLISLDRCPVEAVS